MRRMSIVAYVVFAFLIGMASPQIASGADDPVELYNKGNAAFMDGDYATAKNLYKRALDESGSRNPSLYNNLASASLYQGEIGKAILYYKKGLEISPRDAVMSENLRKAVSLRKERIENGNTDGIVSKAATPLPRLSLNEHAGLFLMLLTAFVAALLLKRISIAKGGHTSLSITRTVIIAGILLGVQGVTLITKTATSLNPRHGVVVSETVTVRSEPDSASERLFDLHDGAEVLLLDEAGEFSEIVLPTGWKGWIPRQAIEII